MMSSIKYKVKKFTTEFLKRNGWVDKESHERLLYDYKTVVRQRNNYMDQLSRVRHVVNEFGGPSINNWDAFEQDTEIELYNWAGHE
jgi:hypothetical protein